MPLLSAATLVLILAASLAGPYPAGAAGAGPGGDTDDAARAPAAADPAAAVDVLPQASPDAADAAPDPADPGADAPAPPRTLTVPAKGPSRYPIGPEDVLRVQVVGHPEFDATPTVTAKGTIVMPILNEVEVKGLTPDDVQARLETALANGYLRAPKVLVEVSEYNNMKVWVFGLVKNPGELRLTGPTTLLDLLSLVGDVQHNAGSTVTIERTKTTHERDADGKPVEASETDTLSVDLDALLRSGDLSQNVALQNGDKIYVPPSAAKVYALGEVTHPGFYPWRDGMTLSDLIQMAGGTTEYANTKKIRIRRASVPKPIVVNLKAFYKNGDLERNVPLFEGDVVVVNSSFFL